MPEQAALERRIEALEDDVRRNQETHREFHNKFSELDVYKAVATDRQTDIMKTLGKLESKVDEILNKPAKRWEGITTQIITAIVGALIGLLIGGFIP